MFMDTNYSDQDKALAYRLKLALAKKPTWLGAWTFITEFCQTDFLKMVDGQPVAVCERIPKYKYLKKRIKDIHMNRKIAVPKSRRMLITWIVLAYCLWYAMTHANSSIYLVKIKQDDAGFTDPNEGLCSRIMKLYSRLPKELQQGKAPTTTKQPPTIHFQDNSSVIRGVAEGKDQLRGIQANVIVIDEMAFLDKARETLVTLLPIVTTGAKLIAVSTPNGQNLFYEICQGIEGE